MRKIILWMSVSLDGFVAGPDDDLGWHVIDEEIHRYFNDRARELGGFIDGRRTYETMTAFWPTADEDPSNPDYVVEFARIWKAKPKIVFSRTLPDAACNTRILREVDPKEVARIKQQADGDLGLGGAEISATFMRLNLVDEWWLFVMPVAIGAGKPLFGGLQEPLQLTLLDTRTFGSGVVLLRYARAS